MTNISKIDLSKGEEQTLTNQLYTLLSDKSGSKISTLLNNLLGREEQVMLAKRFAVIVMLWRECSMYEIAKKLHVSTSTVTRIERDYLRGEYDDIVRTLKQKSISIGDVLQTIDDILHLGGILPHYGQTHASEAYARRKK